METESASHNPKAQLGILARLMVYVHWMGQNENCILSNKSRNEDNASRCWFRP